MQNVIYISMLISFPETFLILLLGFSLSSKKNINILTIFSIALVQAIFVTVLLLFELGTAFNTIIQILSICIFTMIALKIPIYKAVVPVLMGCLIVGGLQSIVFPIISILLNIDILLLKENTKYAIMFYYPVFLLLILSVTIIKKSLFQLYDI